MSKTTKAKFVIKTVIITSSSSTSLLCYVTAYTCLWSQYHTIHSGIPAIGVKRALGLISPQSFFIWTWVHNHEKYVEIKQFSKVDINQNNISNVILLIKFLVYHLDPRHLQGSRVVYIFVYIMKFLCVSIIRIRFTLSLIISDINDRRGRILIRYSIYR